MPKPSKPHLSHFTASGHAAMVDVSAKQPTRRTATGDTGDVDAGLPPVARRHLDEAPAQFHHLCGRGSLLRAEHRSSLAKACRHVAGDDELHSLERGG